MIVIAVAGYICRHFLFSERIKCTILAHCGTRARENRFARNDSTFNLKKSLGKVVERASERRKPVRSAKGVSRRSDTRG